MLAGRSRYQLLLLLGFLILGGLGATFLEPKRLFSGAAEPGLPPTIGLTRRPAADGNRETVQCLGRLEPGRGVFNISAAEGSRVDKLKVEEGQHVKAGTLLATTDAHDELAAEKKYNESQLKEARDQYAAETRRGESLIEEAKLAVKRVEEVVCHEVCAQRAQVKLFEAHLEESTRDFNRVKTLRRTDSSSKEEFERLETTVARMNAQLNAGRETLAKLDADQKVAMLEATAKLETARANLLKAQKAIPVDSLEARVALLAARLERTELRAPVDGHVLRIFTWPGERVTTKPVLQMGETGKMYAVAEVYETDVRFIEQGQRATVTSPALGQELSGTVELIGQRIYKNDVLSVDPRAETDTRVIEVRIRLDDPALARKFVYLQVDVRIDVAGRAGQGRP
jgi:HlyD family secretion protein